MNYSLDSLSSSSIVFFAWYSIILLLFGSLVFRFVNLIQQLVIKAYGSKKSFSDSDSGRQITIIHSITWVIHVLVGLAIILMIGSKAGLPPSFLTSIGTLVGAGIGFGSQEIFRDIFKGGVNLGEKQFSVGDTVRINSTGGAFTGTVEKVTLRYVAIRTEDNLTCIPQGIISVVENYSEGNGSFAVELPFNTDVDIVEIVEKISSYMDNIIDRSPHVLNRDEQKAIDSIIDIQLLGVSSVADGTITYRIAGETEPGKQFSAKRALLKYLTMSLNQDGENFATVKPLQPGK